MLLLVGVYLSHSISISISISTVLNSYGTVQNLRHDLHIWIGNESSQDEYGTAAYKMVEADDFLGGQPVQHRQVQDHESDKFKSYFEVLEYLDGGIETGFKHVEPTPENPFLFRVKGTRKKMTLTQIPVSKNSLNEGDSFILIADKSNVWCWHGHRAKPLEKCNSKSWADRMCTSGSVVVLDQGDGDEEHLEFWDYLGDGTIGPDLDDDEEVQDFTPLLFRVDGDPTKELELVATGTSVQKTSKVMSCLPKEGLDPDDVFLLDSGWEIFVWVGKGADSMERLASMGGADRYAKMEPRALNVPVVILKEGQETEQFKSYFH
jgi:gelsolin